VTAWQLLGLAPTNDKRAIRHAYATLLKALDVDKDPQAFEQLRRARDWALASADAESFQGEPLAEGRDAPADEEASAEPAEPIPEWLREVAAHHAALMEILSAGDGQTPTDDEHQAAMLAHFEGMLADPRLADVGFEADAEQWFAQTIAHGCPRANPLVLPAARRFRWLKDGDEVNRSQEIAWLTRHARTMLFLEEVGQPGHRYHKEWQELCTPAYEGSRRGRWIRRGKVRQLLALVRGSYPSLESCFDWYRVSLWEKPFVFSGFRGLGLVVWLGILLLGRLHSPQTTTPPQPAIPDIAATTASAPALQAGGPLSDPAADIDAVLQPLFGQQISAFTLAHENPKLFAILKNYWTTDRNADVGRSEFRNEIQQLLFERFPGDLRKTSYPLAAGFRTFQLDQLQSAVGESYENCDATLSGHPRVPLSDYMIIRRNALIGQILLHSDDGSPPPKTASRYFVPGEVMTKAIGTSGLTAAQFRAAMAGQGTAETRCRKQIALLKAVLALPQRDGLALLRKM
jgi:hypothetical protein